MKITDVKELEKIANEIRIGIIEEVYAGKSGHPGGSLSCADILTVLYFNQMNINPEEPKSPARDRFVLSKGHASPALYSTLAQRGYFDKKELFTFRGIDSILQGHPDMKHIKGIDMSTGSLGQGLSCANGMAISSKLNGDGFRVYCLVAKTVKGKPTAIIAKTVKGKGVSFMENQAGWHGKAPNEEQYNLAIEELKGENK